jgi:hypothetical protein
MHPCRGKQNVVVEGAPFGEACGEAMEARLMTELVGRLRVCADALLDGLAVSG